MLLQVSDARRASPPGEQAVLRPQRHMLTPVAAVAREDPVTRGVKSVTSYVIFFGLGLGGLQKNASDVSTVKSRVALNALECKTVIKASKSSRTLFRPHMIIRIE